MAAVPEREPRHRNRPADRRDRARLLRVRQRLTQPDLDQRGTRRREQVLEAGRRRDGAAAGSSTSRSTNAGSRIDGALLRPALPASCSSRSSCRCASAADARARRLLGRRTAQSLGERELVRLGGRRLVGPPRGRQLGLQVGVERGHGAVEERAGPVHDLDRPIAHQLAARAARTAVGGVRDRTQSAGRQPAWRRTCRTDRRGTPPVRSPARAPAATAASSPARTPGSGRR